MNPTKSLRLSRPSTARGVARGARTIEDFGRNFRDWFHELKNLSSRAQLAAAVRVRPPSMASRFPDGAIADAYLASQVEFMCRRAGLQPPHWTRDPCYVLDEPWFSIPGRHSRPHLLLETPDEFRNRNVFTTPEGAVTIRRGRPRVSRSVKLAKARLRQQRYRHQIFLVASLLIFTALIAQAFTNDASNQTGFQDEAGWLTAGVLTFAALQASLIISLLVNRSRWRRSEAEAALIADISSKFVNLPPGDVDREIENAQRRLCESVGLDFSTLWQWSDEPPGVFKLTHFYRALEGPRSPDRMTEDQYPWAKQLLLAGNIIRITSVDSMPPEAARDADTLRQFGIKSNLAIPLSVGGGPPFGILGLGTLLKERTWAPSLVNRLQLVAQIFANSLSRKRDDQTIRDSEERMTLAAEAAKFGVWVWNTDRNQIWGSKRWRNLFGFSSPDGIDIESVIERIHPEDRETVETEVRRVIANQGEYEGEFRTILPDGSQRWIVSRGQAHPETRAIPARMLGAAIDITERKRAEEAYRASETRLNAGADLAGLGYYEVDLAEPSTFVDDRFHEIFGLPPGQHVGLRSLEFWMEYLHPDDRARVLEERRKLHDGTIEQLSIEYRYQDPNKGLRWIHHLAGVASRDANRHAVRTFGVTRDITPQKKAEMDVEELRGNLTHLTRVNSLGALSGSLAHELNQPLGIILSNAQAAQEMLDQDEPDLIEIREILSDIVAADRRASEVIQRLRSLLKRGQVVLQSLSLNGVIEEVLQLARADLIGRGVTVVGNLAPDLPSIAGDRVQLQQVVLNLILNSAEAMADNPQGSRRLHFQTSVIEGRARVSVRDEGSGLPADIEPLFQPFFSTKPQGLGMGLAICRSIVAAHGGRLWAEPNPGGGAIFHLVLPITPEPTDR